MFNDDLHFPLRSETIRICTITTSIAHVLEVLHRVTRKGKERKKKSDRKKMSESKIEKRGSRERKRE